MRGRRRLGPMKATAEATPVYTAGVLPDPFVARTFVDPAWAPRKRISPLPPSAWASVNHISWAAGKRAVLCAEAYIFGAPGSPTIMLPDMRNTNGSAGDHLGQVLYTCAVQN